MAKSSNSSRKSRRNVVALSKQPRDTIVSIRRSLVGTVAKVAADTGTYTSLRLLDFPGNSDASSLFAQYRISRVELKFILVSAPNNNATFPTLYIAPQFYTPSGTPASRDEVLQFEGMQTHQFGPSNLTKTISVKPRLILDVGGQIGGGQVVPAGWCSINNTGLQHLGFVHWISRYNSTSDPTHTLDIEYTIHFDGRMTR